MPNIELVHDENGNVIGHVALITAAEQAEAERRAAEIQTAYALDVDHDPYDDWIDW